MRVRRAAAPQALAYCTVRHSRNRPHQGFRRLESSTQLSSSSQVTQDTWHILVHLYSASRGMGDA